MPTSTASADVELTRRYAEEPKKYRDPAVTRALSISPPVPVPAQTRQKPSMSLATLIPQPPWTRASLPGFLPSLFFRSVSGGQSPLDVKRVMKSNIKERTEYDAAIVCDQTNLSPTGEPRTLPSRCRLYMMIYGDGSTGQ
jgi:hypothetical protein